MKGDIDNNLMLKHAIEQWPVRIRRAKKTQLELAKLSKISDCHLSQIINFQILKPRLTTLNKIEAVLKDWGV